MEQRLRLGGLVEVAMLVPQNEVGHVGGAASDLLPELFVFGREEREPTESVAGDEQQQQRGEYACDTATVELDEAETLSFETVEDDRRDEEARDDEEDVNPDEAAPDYIPKSVKADNRQHRYGTHAVYVRPVCGMCQTFRVRL